MLTRLLLDKCNSKGNKITINLAFLTAFRLCGLKPGTVFAVVIDTTESMAVEIDAVKTQVQEIVSATKNTPDEPLEYLLVPFNDPFDENAVVSSTNADEFINLVSQVEASGGGDQREPMIDAMRAAAIRCPVRSTIFLFTDAPASDDADNAFEEVQAMLIAKKIELNIYLTEPDLKDWDTVEHRTLARISGGLIYRITKDKNEVGQAAKYLQTSAEESKSFLYIGDDMTTDSIEIKIDAAIRSISVFSYATNENVDTLSIANTVSSNNINGASVLYSETNGNRVVYKSDNQMDFNEADNFCKNQIGGRLVLLKDSAYRDEFHANVDAVGGWIGISRAEGNMAYSWSDGKTVFPAFNGFLSLGNTKRCAFYDSKIRDDFGFTASWQDDDCDEAKFAYCERVDVQLEESINLNQFKLFRVSSILPGTYRIKVTGTINDEKDDTDGSYKNSYNLRIWAATYMSLASNLFYGAQTEQVSTKKSEFESRLSIKTLFIKL